LGADSTVPSNDAAKDNPQPSAFAFWYERPSSQPLSGWLLYVAVQRNALDVIVLSVMLIGVIRA
jgi:hypothetical protein